MTIKTIDSTEYLVEMEKAKKQYEQYLKVSEIYKLPIFQSIPAPQYMPPSIESPLTTNKITLAE